jgi:uncharacterized phage-associated protein
MQYSEKKAAQVAAYFLFRAKERVEILKLMKLMYLAERASYQKYGEPLTGDQLFSMDHGPVLSSTLDHMNKFVPSSEGGWETWVSDRENHLLGLQREIKDPRKELSQLSDADLEILESIWQEFGKYRAFDLAKLTHKICQEWEDPKGSAIPIPYFRLLRVLGYDPDVAKELEQRIACQQDIDSAFTKALR